MNYYGYMEASKLSNFSLAWAGIHLFILITFCWEPRNRWWEDWSWLGYVTKQQFVIVWVCINTLVWLMMALMA